MVPNAMLFVQLGTIVIPFLVLVVLFGVLESLWPDDRGQPKWRRDSVTDALYYILGYGTRLVASIAVLIAIGISAHVLPRTGLLPVGRQPAWLQGLEMLLLGDLIGYWTHRYFHSIPSLWRIHAVHHSSEQLDWLSSARVHPIEPIVSRLATVLPLYLLGFSGVGLAPYAVFLAVYPLYLHANVPWGYGPFGYVIASPAFHRWHHSSERAALDKNFSGLFPAIDLVFGTAYFPRRRSSRFGLYREQMPQGLFRQCVYPFRRRAQLRARGR